MRRHGWVRVSACCVIIAVLAASGADGASAVTRHEIRHSEELKFKGVVEGVIYHSEGAAFDDHQKFVVALEAEPKDLGAAGRALTGEWRTYRSYDQGHLFRIPAPAFWRHDWREWKRSSRSASPGTMGRTCTVCPSRSTTSVSQAGGYAPVPSGSAGGSTGPQ